ncbi:EFR1 family ferrodoxin, partial [uncultured Duncaniella sp.]|uniref:EFR1 family ferrodoxin n=1 Tax=uncultured Duncaniella sp. TaxID=2768039 RepID=UPI0026205F75
EGLLTSNNGEYFKSIGFVFPIYSWGVPPIMAEFIKSLPQNTIDFIRRNNIPVWMTATCGDETGNSHKMFRKIISKRGLILNGAWSVIMPNTYVLLPGFDIDSDDVRENKIKEAPKQINAIVNKIRRGEWEIKPTVGGIPFLKTALFYPLFKKYGIFPSRWRANDKCVSCSLCSKSCPVGNITMSKNRPQWGEDCTSCLACYHACPVHAIEYGNVTKRKGQYKPDQRPGGKPT